ncbi:MAG: molybdopterin molybdotransferase MoeA [Planctomycetota bacterium]|jgi:molybdopterin molybdotransferase
MLPFEKAFETVLNSARPLGMERVDLANAANRILAEDVQSDEDMPPFNKSAMDGFACRRADLANELTAVEIIPAGHVPTKTIGVKQCAKIMTGGMVPPGADCVFMKEYVEICTENTVRFVGEKTADNICQKGEDIRADDLVLRKGTLLKPQHVAVLASVGNTQPLVAKRPRVAVIATGNELVEPVSKPDLSQIRNSNSLQLSVQIESIGAVATSCGIAKDMDKAIDSMFEEAVEENDVVIISGGVSVGDFDLVPDILKQNGVELMFEKIAIKPGKPTVFGLCDEAFCFGLPGNPLATFVIFELLVKPFLYKLMGYHYKHHDIRMPLGDSIKRKKTKRQRWFPVAITEMGTVKPVEYHGSAHISSLCSADGLMSIDIDVAEIEKGTMVPVRLI